MTTEKSQKGTQKFEKDWNRPIYQHPYFLYVGLTFGLFLFLVVMGYLAIENDWIPKR